MRRYRPLLLFLILLALLSFYYVYTFRPVQVETIPLESKLMGKTLPYTVVLPLGYRLITSPRKYPVLYLLHGWSGRPQGWLTDSKLKEYAERHRLIIVLPEGGLGWYTDSATVPADKYESYILQELIPDVENRFRVIKDRGARAVGGLSMGGYGAIKFGLKHPEVFALVASMSGAFDAVTRTDDDSIMRTFGDVDNPARPANDLFKLTASLPDDQLAALPYFYFDCGAGDYWLKVNRDLANTFSERKIAYEYRELPGIHDWNYWDRQVQEIMRLAEQRLLPAR
jgi:putative tributyrin esterase